MKIEPVLRCITIYPVKSLDGMVLKNAVISAGGCLLHDREYAMSDEEGNFISGKTNPLVHALRSNVDFENEIISFRHGKQATWNHFHLQKEKEAIQSYLTEYFGVNTQLIQNTTGRFMDIPDISGATILSTSSLQAVSAWFNNMDLEETRKRFRATLEMEGVPAFWEDHLFSMEGRGIEFKVGDVTMFGISPRARCVVPTRNPETGEVIHAFPRTFARQRASTLPEWSTLENYGHHYYLTVNCYIPPTEIGKRIETGVAVKIIGEKDFS
ncbi:MAG: MOSC N-terminal beta barrel domain-containing protein [Chitinophagales bacterium]